MHATVYYHARYITTTPKTKAFTLSREKDNCKMTAKVCRYFRYLVTTDLEFVPGYSYEVV